MKKFAKPELEIVKLETEDVVCTSGGLIDGSEGGDQSDYGGLFGE